MNGRGIKSRRSDYFPQRSRRDRSAEELDRETGEDETTVGRTRRKDGG